MKAGARRRDSEPGSGRGSKGGRVASEQESAEFPESVGKRRGKSKNGERIWIREYGKDFSNRS
eukprot:4557805-Pleurochrysis_carterae.AAC.1